MRFIDLSQPVYADCPNCPVHPPVRSDIIADHAKSGWLVENLTLTAHTGSHLDAPLHKFAGTKSIDQLPLERFTGLAVMADMRDCRPDQPFTSSMLGRKLRLELEDRIVIIATGWGQKRAKTDEWLKYLPYLSPDGAEWLVEQKIRGVATDTYSIGGAREQQNNLTHEILLRAEIWILEDIRLPDELFSLAQPFELWCLPINLRGFSGSFCRPVVVVR
jgi:kynurenine formamidase